MFTRQKNIYIYVLIELIYYIIKELEITDAVVFQTACIAQDDFFYVAPFKKSLCKIGLAEISNIEFAKTRADFFLYHTPAIFCQNEFAIISKSFI